MFTTAPSGPPTNVSVDEVHSRSIILSWEHPLEEERNGIISGVKIQLTESNSTSVFEAENTTVLISEGIKPFTQYYCKVAAFTMAGVGPYTEGISFKTQEDGKTVVESDHSYK